MEKTMVCSDSNINCPRTEEERKVYEKNKRNSERLYINEDGELLIEVTEYA